MEIFWVLLGVACLVLAMAMERAVPSLIAAVRHRRRVHKREGR